MAVWGAFCILISVLVVEAILVFSISPQLKEILEVCGG